MVQVSKRNSKSGRMSSNFLSIRWCLRVSILSVGLLAISYSFFPEQKERVQGSLRKIITKSKFMVDATSASRIIASGRPYILYGTAWKKAETTRLVSAAIRNGFRFIDTACQPKHYNEAGVGDGWVLATQELGLDRSDIYLQTKFTSLSGQDQNDLPYDKDASLEEQVKQSIEMSLKNLHTTYLDRLVMHSPMNSMQETMLVWRVFESFVAEGKVRELGISNCYDLETFTAIYDQALIKPSALQNRFYADSDFDVNLRQFCKDKNIMYQSFWTLSGNRSALATAQIRKLATVKKLTPQTLMYAFMMTIGHTPLSGTTSDQHMTEDVAIMERIQGGEIILDANEVKFMSKILGIPESS